MVLASPLVVPLKDPQRPALILDKRLYKAVNLLRNNRFTSTNGWSTVGNGFTWSVADNEATITNMGTAASGWKLYQYPTTIVGHVYYLVAWVQTNSTSDGISMNGTVNKYHSGSGNYERLSIRFTCNNSRFEVRALHSTRTGDVSSSPVKTRYVMFIDLTATFGAGHEPTQTECDVLFLEYFSDYRYVYYEDKVRMLENLVPYPVTSKGWQATTVSDGVVTVVGNGTSKYPSIQYYIPPRVLTGHKYYVKATMKVDASNCSQLQIMLTQPANINLTPTYVALPPLADTWYIGAGTAQFTAEYSQPTLKFLMAYSDASYTAGKTLWIKDVILIDLTASYGAGNEPAKTMMDSIVTSYFTGKRAA